MAQIGGRQAKLQSREKNVGNLALFLEPENVAFNHHIHHAFHHDLTIQKPRFARAFSQKPLQKHHSTTTKKIRFKVQIFSRCRLRCG
jgi:hypothetical protein